MKLTSQPLLAQFCNLLQTELFPILEASVGALSKPAKLLASVVSMIPVSQYVGLGDRQLGRPQHDRQALATAFFAKAVYNLTTTRQLIERLHSDAQFRRLCGWDTAAQVPTESTFSRAFQQFAAAQMPQSMHQALIQKTQSKRVIQHIARDSTAIEPRERLPEDREKARAKKNAAAAGTPAPDAKPFAPAVKKKSKVAKNQPQRRGHKGGPHQRSKARERGKRIQRQQHMKLSEMLADLPQECSLTAKMSSKGHKQYWRGYKLHWDVADGGRIPISCILTGAVVHDSQVAIPLMTMSAERVRWRYDVMDAAYDAGGIRSRSKELKHEAIIQPVQRHNQKAKRELNDEQKQHFKTRTIVEQLNGRLKDEFGGRIIYVRGAAKIMAHLMFGVVALTVDQLLRLST